MMTIRDGSIPVSIPAITIWQPWASLIMLGFKPYEFRGWPAPRNLRGHRIAIHAGARKAKKDEIADLILRLEGDSPWTTGLRPEAIDFLKRVHLSPELLVLSHVLCTATLGKSKHGAEIAAEFGEPVNDSDRHQHSNWGWPLTDVRPLEPPVPAKGMQGFWKWSA